MGVEIRQARLDDYEDVAAFTTDTWADQREDGGDYIPQVFEDWVASDDEYQRTFVADVDGTAAGVLQMVRLSDHEAWAQGMRVDPDHRGTDLGLKMTHAGFEWARERGATVARNMVFSWNVMGLGLSRAAGFDPEAEFRWVHPDPDPDPDATHDYEETTDVNTAWRALQSSTASDELAGLGLDLDESWALSEITKDTLRSSDSRLALRNEDGARATAYRVRDYERENGDGDPVQWAEYGVAAWHDTESCAALMAAISRDAADLGVEKTRVLIPETVHHVSDVAAARVDIGTEPDFVTAADVTADYRS